MLLKRKKKGAGRGGRGGKVTSLQGEGTKYLSTED